MNILIDSTQIPLGRTGVGLYAEHLLRQLSPILAPNDRLFVLVQSDDLDLRNLIGSHPNLTPLFVSSSIFRNRLALAAFEQFILPCLLLYHRIDVVHSLHYTFPLLSPCRTVVTLHDMTHSLWPELHTRGRRIAMAGFARLALRRADGVLFVSESTRQDSEHLFGKGRNLRVVTPLAVDHSAFDVQHAAVEQTLSRLRIQRPYILFIGTLEPRKNIPRLIRAFDSLDLRYAGHHLVIVGKLGWHYEAALQAIQNSPNSARIHRLGYVAAEDKAPLMAGCDLLVYPSLYEGFGLPVLEAMAAGAPVVTSAVSSLPEVAGTAAVLVNPASVDEIASAIDSVLSNESYRNQLREAGKKQSHKFSWETTARLTYAAYAALNTGRHSDHKQ